MYLQFIGVFTIFANLTNKQQVSPRKLQSTYYYLKFLEFSEVLFKFFAVTLRIYLPQI